jgi:hypothetical protein
VLFRSVLEASSKITSVCFIVLVIAVRHGLAELSEVEQKIAQDAFYNEPEMKLTPVQKAGLRNRVAIANNTARWAGGKIPYEIDASIPSDVAALVRQAAEHIRTQTGNCIQWVPRKGEAKYVRVVKGNGCSSWLGMYGTGVQDLNLGNGCGYIGTVVHEMLHAVGFDHEQNRPDRDNYLNIFRQNIEPGKEFNFDKTPGGQTYNNFDFDSVMLYGEYAFSKQRGVLRTMQDKTGKHVLTEPYDKKGMTATDVFQVKKFYGCP